MITGYFTPVFSPRGYANSLLYSFHANEHGGTGTTGTLVGAGTSPLEPVGGPGPRPVSRQGVSVAFTVG